MLEIKCEDISMNTSPGKIFIFSSHLIPVEDSRVGAKSEVLLRRTWLSPVTECPMWPFRLFSWQIIVSYTRVQFVHFRFGLDW